MMDLPVFAIARMTIREALRRRLLLAVVLLTLLMVAFSAWGFDRITELSCDNEPCSPTEVRLLAATLVVLITFMYSFVFTLGAVFFSTPTIGGEVETGIALAILPRPIRRSDIILGKWLGWAIIIGTYAIATTGLEFVAVNWLTGYSPPYALEALAFLLAECLVMLTLGILFSTRLPAMVGGIIALVLYGVGWMGGVAHGVGVALEADAVKTVGTVTSIILPTDGLWRGALYSMQPPILFEQAGLSRAMAANPFLTSQAPAPGYVAWAVVWIVGMLVLAIVSFERREV